MDEIKLIKVGNILYKKQKQLAKMFPKKIANKILYNCYFAGGCIYSLYHDKEPKDFDLFCGDIETAKVIKEYCERKKKYTIITENAITLNEFQIVTKWVGKPEEVVTEFDFCHNMSYCQQGQVEVYCKDYFEGDILHFNFERGRDIASTITRVPKFISRGMKITRTEMAKILEKLCSDGIIEDEKVAISKLCNNNYDGY